MGCLIDLEVTGIAGVVGAQFRTQRQSDGPRGPLRQRQQFLPDGQLWNPFGRAEALSQHAGPRAVSIGPREQKCEGSQGIRSERLAWSCGLADGDSCMLSVLLQGSVGHAV